MEIPVRTTECYYAPMVKLSTIAILLTILVINIAVPFAEGQILGVPLGQSTDTIPPDTILTAEDWIKSVLTRWTPDEANAWNSLSPNLRHWVAQIMWDQQLRHGGLRTLIDLSFRLDMPAGCTMTAFVTPSRIFSFSDTQAYLQTLMSNVEWQNWVRIKAPFRGNAEILMMDEHYALIWLQAKKAWWFENRNIIDGCIRQARATAMSSSLLGSSQLTDAEIDKRADAEKQKVRDALAPARVKEEANEKIDAHKEIDKYIRDMDRSDHGPQGGIDRGPQGGRESGPQGSKGKP